MVGKVDRRTQYGTVWLPVLLGTVLQCVALVATIFSPPVFSEPRLAQLSACRIEFVRLRNIDPTTDDSGVRPLWLALSEKMERAAAEVRNPNSFEEVRLLVDLATLYNRLYTVSRDVAHLTSATEIAERLAAHLNSPGEQVILETEARLIVGDIALAQGAVDEAQVVWSGAQRPRDRRLESRLQGITNGTFTTYKPSPELAAPQLLRVGSSERKGIPLRKSKKLIVIDPGHGGDDVGAVGKHGLLEKEITLDLGRKLQSILHAQGFRVALTRSDDTFVPLARRTHIANHLQAGVFVSLHHNASPNHNLDGLESFYLDNTDDQAGRKLAERENSAGVSGSADDIDFMLSDLIQTGKLEDSIRLTETINSSLVRSIGSGPHGVKVRGVKKAPFYVLVGAHMPCTLLEILFVDHVEDATKLSSGVFRDKVVWGIAQGIASFLGRELVQESGAKRTFESDTHRGPPSVTAGNTRRKASVSSKNGKTVRARNKNKKGIEGEA